MKTKNKIKYLLSIFTFLLVISCSKEDYFSAEPNQTINLEKVKNVFNLKGDSQLIAYRMLSKGEKIHIWKNKLSSLAKSKKMKSSQASYIKNLEKTITFENFFNIEKRISYSDYLKEMKKIGYTLFSAKEMTTYFSSLNYDVVQIQESKVIDEGEGGGPHCGCNTVDEWCDYYEDCKVAVCTAENTDGGCGWFLLEDCNGSCGPE